jgi:pyruvate dehydrogenase E1 component beta subunit
MAQLNLLQAINRALHEEMARDERIILLGEDVGISGGVFLTTQGLYEKFGAERVVDTPLSEHGILGTAVGLAMSGLRPIAEIQFIDFVYPGFTQVVNQIAKMRYRSGGDYPVPMVIRAPCGGGIKGGHYHSQSPETYFIHTAGLITVMPATPSEALGLLKAAIRSDDPVVFLEPKRIYRAVREEVPDGETEPLPLGKAAVVREGRHVTLITYGAMLHPSLEAVDAAKHEGIDVEVINLRTLWPLDVETVIASVRQTGRCVIVHEAPRTLGLAAELIALINERTLLYLEAPVKRVTGYDIPFPYTYEHYYLPTKERILDGIREAVQF